MDQSDPPEADGGGMWPDPASLWRAWWGALGLRGPFSGDVTQAIDTSLVRGVGNQLGFINIDTTATGDPALERRIVEEVASYGRQLGRVLDAVDVLIRSDTRGALAPDDQRAIDELQSMRAEIEATKQRAAADDVDRLVSQIRALRSDPAANRAALGRIEDALKDR
jgi:hypothetical protein